MMNIFASWAPKVIAFIGGAAVIVGHNYPQWSALCVTVQGIAFLALGMVTRQDNKSSEQVGAGNTGVK